MKLALFDSLIEFKFGVSVVQYDSYDYYARESKNDELLKWCRQQFGQNYTATFNTFYFKTEEQRNWFVLRWS